MKILAFTDIHGSKKALLVLKNKTKKENPDVLVCAGDISLFDIKTELLLRRIAALQKNVVIVHGNHESERDFPRIAKKIQNIKYIHGTSFVCNDTAFIGYGGGGFAMDDTALVRMQKKLGELIAAHHDKKIVLVAHGPPYNTALDNVGGRHVGSRTLRQFILNSKIDVVICGHLHENFRKKDTIKKTTVINPGPFGMIIKF